MADNKLFELNKYLKNGEVLSKDEITHNLRTIFGDPIDINLIRSTTILNFKNTIGCTLHKVNSLFGYETNSLSKLQLSKVLLEVYNKENDAESLRLLRRFIENNTTHSMMKFYLEEILHNDDSIKTIKTDLSDSIETLSYGEITHYLSKNFDIATRAGVFNRELIHEYFKAIFPNTVSLFLTPKLFAKQAIKRHFGEVLDTENIKLIL